MSTDSPSGSVLIQRFLDKERELIFALGEFDSLLGAYDEHAKLWNHDQSPLTKIMMHQALGGCALYHSCRPLDENSAFTLNVQKPPTNLFFTGSAKEQRVTGRPWVEDVKNADINRLYVQTKRAKGRAFTSVIDVQGLDVLMVLEDYCRRSNQAPARFFELEDGRYLMVASLPREDCNFLGTLDRDSVLQYIDGLPLLDEKNFWFQCGCDPQRLARAIGRMYQGNIDNFFEAAESVDAECPRCGRKWQLRRDLFDEENDQ